MIDNKKIEYAHAINSHTKNIIEALIPKRIVPFDYYEERKIDEEVKNWIERSEGDFAVIIGEAGFGKTSLLCNLANELLKEEHYAVFFVKSENPRGNDFDKKILDDLEITGIGLNAFLRKIIDEHEKVIFLLDTLDVIATDEGIARLDDFLTKLKGENRAVIGASRPLEFKKIEHLTTKTFELKPFSDDEIRRLFDKYKAFYKMGGVELKLPILEVCRNPLHMRMLFEVYEPNEIPEDINTQKLYERYWENKVGMVGVGRLSYLMDDEKKIVAELKDELTKKIAVEMLKTKKIFLEEKYLKEEVFVHSYIKQQASISESENVHVVQEAHQTPTTDHTRLMNNAYYNLLDECVLRAQERKVEFFHQTFFEYAAARALIEEGEESRQSLLEDLLLDITMLENFGIVEQVILYAKKRGDDEIAYKFLIELSERNIYTKFLAINLLKHIENITDEEVEIYRRLRKDEIEIRQYLAKSLKDVIPKHPELATGWIVTLSRDEDWRVRWHAAKVLPKLVEVKPERATGLIVTLSRDEDWRVRVVAVEAFPKLVEVNPEVAIGLVETLSSDEDWWGREAAAKALPKLVEVNPERTTGLIVTFSRDEKSDVRWHAAKALPKLFEVKPELATGLIETLSSDDDWWVRWNAARALLKLFEVNQELATRLIETFCKNKDLYVREAAARTLPELVAVNPEVATGLILTLSRDKDWQVRVVAAEALPKLVEVNPEVATGLILTFSKDEKSWVQGTAAEALLKLAALYPKRARTLIEKLKDVEYIEIQLAIAKIVQKGLLKGKI